MASLLLCVLTTNNTINTCLLGQGHKNLKVMQKSNFFDNDFRLFEEVEKDISPIYGNWEVKENGNLVYNRDGVKNIVKVDKANLSTIDVRHVMSKAWKDYEDARNFFLAYLEALRNAEYKTLSIDLQNHYLSSVK